MAPSKTATKKILRKYWGYLLFPALGFGWFQFHPGPWLLLAASLVLVLYSLFAAPVPCCAPTRDGSPCRLNSRGMLRGCWYQQHKWQNARLLIHRDSWAQFQRNVFNSLKGNAAALGVIIGALSALASLVQAASPFFMTKG